MIQKVINCQFIDEMELKCDVVFADAFVAFSFSEFRSNRIIAGSQLISDVNVAPIHDQYCESL